MGWSEQINIYLPVKVSFWYFMSLSSTWLLSNQHSMHFWFILLQCSWLMCWCNAVILLKDMNIISSMCWAFVAAEACFLIKYWYIFTIVLINDRRKWNVQCFTSSVPPEWTLIQGEPSNMFWKTEKHFKCPQ